MQDSIHSFKAMLTRKRYAARTIESYSDWVTEFLKFHHGDKNHQLDDAAAKTFLRHLQSRGLSASTVNLARSGLTLYYTHAAGYTPDLKQFSAAFRVRAAPEIPTQEEILSASEKIKSPIYKELTLLIYGMGLELNEAINIKVSHVDFSAKTISFKGRSRSKSRTSVIPACMLDILLKHANEKKATDYLFTIRGQKTNDSTLQRALKNAFRSAGITNKYSARSLRYAYAKHLEALGYPIGDVIDSLGIASDLAFKFYYDIGAAKRRIEISPLDVRIIKVADHAPIEDYVSLSRIKQISDLDSKAFDFTKLIALLGEINAASKSNCYLSIAMCARALIDHVPPLFGFQSFKQVIANYSSTRSWKKSMEHLDNSLRNCADSYLHLPIRPSEAYPTFQQVDFRSDLDALLQEIVRINRRAV